MHKDIQSISIHSVDVKVTGYSVFPDSLYVGSSHGYVIWLMWSMQGTRDAFLPPVTTQVTHSLQGVAASER